MSDDRIISLQHLAPNIKVGEVVKRIWGDGFMESQMRVCDVDNDFVSCNEQTIPDGSWIQLPLGSDPWKFDRKWGVETDASQGWGVEFGLCLSRIEKIES